MTRQITVDLTAPASCGARLAGRIGEHNATELIIIPPKMFFENEKITHYAVAFAFDCKLVHSEPVPKKKELKMLLWSQLTQNEYLSAQLEGRDAAGDLLAKSEPFRLRFLNSVCGDEVQSDTDNPDFVSDYLKNKHSHNNKDVIDKFSVNEKGDLLFNGEEIEGGGQMDNISADKVFYENPMLADESGTVKGALDEAVGFVLTKIPELQEQVENKQPKGDYITENELNAHLADISGLSVEVVNELPAENAKEKTLYLVGGIKNALPNATDDMGNIYNGTGYKENTKWNHNLGDVSADGVDITGYIPVKSGDIVYLKNIDIRKADTSNPFLLLFTDDDYYTVAKEYYTNTASAVSPVWNNGVLESFEVPQSNIPITHMRIQSSDIDTSSVVSINTTEGNLYTEYLYINGKWEKVGGGAFASPESSEETPTSKVEMVEVVIDMAEGYISTDYTAQTMSFETSKLPADARVKKIEIPDVVNGTGEYIQLEDMVAKDPVGVGAPYFIIYPKNAQNIFTIAAVVTFIAATNGFFEAASSYLFGDKTIKIYYEIEG